MLAANTWCGVDLNALTQTARAAVLELMCVAGVRCWYSCTDTWVLVGMYQCSSAGVDVLV